MRYYPASNFFCGSKTEDKISKDAQLKVKNKTTNMITGWTKKEI